MVQISSPPSSIDSPWHGDPDLQGLFHPDCPDDVEVLFFFPHKRVKEKMWVRLQQIRPDIGGYQGELLNSSYTLNALTKGRQIMLRKSPGLPAPFYLTPEMLENQRDWDIHCTSCGFDAVFRPIGELASMQFPDAPDGALPVAFTTRCPLCKDTMTLELKETKRNFETSTPGKLPPPHAYDPFVGQFVQGQKPWKSTLPTGTGQLQVSPVGVQFDIHPTFPWWQTRIWLLGLLPLAMVAALSRSFLPQLSLSVLAVAVSLAAIGLLTMDLRFRQQVTEMPKQEFRANWAQITQILHDLEQPQILTLGLRDPNTDGFVHFRSPDPADIQTLLNTMRYHIKQEQQAT